MSNKQKRMFAILLLLLLLCGGGLWLADYLNNRPAEEGESEAVSLSAGLGAIVRMGTVSGRGGLNFLLQDGVWTVEGQEDYPLNTATVQTLADMLQNLTALQTLDSTRLDSMEAYGLETPARYVTATDEEGKSRAFYLGINLGGNNYLQVQGDSNIYTVSGTLESYLDYTLEELFLLDEMPSLTDSTVVSFTVSGLAEVTLTPVITESTDESGYVTSAAQWFSGETDVTEQETVAAAVKELKRLSFADNLDYSGSSEALAQYGLDRPAMTLRLRYLDSDGQPLDLTLTAGDMLEDGSYAVRLGESRQINRMEPGSLSALLQLAAAGLS